MTQSRLIFYPKENEILVKALDPFGETDLDRCLVIPRHDLTNLEYAVGKSISEWDIADIVRWQEKVEWQNEIERRALRADGLLPQGLPPWVRPQPKPRWHSRRPTLEEWTYSGPKEFSPPENFYGPYRKGFCVYQINYASDEPFYVGSSEDLNRRAVWHLMDAVKRNYHKCTAARIIRDLMEKGEHFYFRQVSFHFDRDEVEQAEYELMRALKKEGAQLVNKRLSR